MHGPASTSGGSYKAPTWPRLSKLDVLDTIAVKLGPVRRTLWRKYRTAALDKWAVAGFKFIVQEDSPAGYPKIDLATAGTEEGLCRLAVPGKLRLMSMPGLLGGSLEAFGDWRCGGGITAYRMGRKFWTATVFRRNFMLTHEIGHALGLNHRPLDEANRSVMNGKFGSWSKPDAHDIDSLRRYYF